jgi:hypothetical protein
LTALDRAVCSRSLDEGPARLPDQVRTLVALATGQTPIDAYALIDLDAEPRPCERWLALTPGWVVLHVPGEPALVAPRASVQRCSLERGLSCNTLRIELCETGLGTEAPASAVLARAPAAFVVRDTQRQRSAVERIRAALDGELQPKLADAVAAYAAEVARPIRNAQALVSKSSVFILARLLRYLLPYRSVLGLGAAAVITLCALLPPYLTGYLIDDVLRPVQGGSVAAGDVALIDWACVGAMALVYLLRRAAAWLRLRLMAVLGEYVARNLRGELYDHLQELSIAFYSRKKTGSLITRLSSETDRLWHFLAFGVVDLPLSVVMLVGLCAVLIRLDPVLGALMALPLPGIYFAIHGVSRSPSNLVWSFALSRRRWRGMARPAAVAGRVRLVLAATSAHRVFEIRSLRPGRAMLQPPTRRRPRLPRGSSSTAPCALWLSRAEGRVQVKPVRCFSWSCARRRLARHGLRARRVPRRVDRGGLRNAHLAHRDAAGQAHLPEPARRVAVAGARRRAPRARFRWRPVSPAAARRAR